MKLIEIKSKAYSKGYLMKDLYKMLGLSRQSFYKKIKRKNVEVLIKINEILS